MPNQATAEIYFISAMMILILVVCGASVFFFFRQMKREKGANKPTRAKIIEREKKRAEKENASQH